MAQLDDALAYWKVADYEGSGDLLEGKGDGYGPDLVLTGCLFLEPEGYQSPSTPGTQFCYFPNVANNYVRCEGLSVSTAYDFTVTYKDDTTDTGDVTTDGSGHAYFNGIDTEFQDKSVKSIQIVPDGGGAQVAFADFTDRTAVQQPFATFTGDEGKTWTFGRPNDGYRMCVVSHMLLLINGTGTDKFTGVDNDALDWSGQTDDWTILAIMRIYPGHNGGVFFKKGAFGADEGWAIQGLSSDNVRLYYASPGMDRAINWVGGKDGNLWAYAGCYQHDRATESEYYSDDTLRGSDTFAINDMSNSEPIRGGVDKWGTNKADYEFLAAACWDRTLSGSDVAEAKTELLTKTPTGGSGVSGLSRSAMLGLSLGL